MKIINFLNTFKLKDELKFNYNFPEMGGSPIISDVKGTYDCIVAINKKLLNKKKYGVAFTQSFNYFL
ncbi:MAG: hypothetical protein K1W33_01035 [Clostridia bacterium]